MDMNASDPAISDEHRRASGRQSDELAAAADRLRSLHRRGDPLVLVNAWDVASAERVAAAGATAVATSSAAMAAALGVPDDRSTPVELMLEGIARIAAAVDLPVSADLLDGYGLDGAELVDRLLAAGAVGCNLEDSDHERPGARWSTPMPPRPASAPSVPRRLAPGSTS